jgi:hypothetical protein
VIVTSGTGAAYAPARGHLNPPGALVDRRARGESRPSAGLRSRGIITPSRGIPNGVPSDDERRERHPGRLGLLIHFVIKGGKAGGYELVLSGSEIWATSVLIFAVVYWELDGGGPVGRASGVCGPPWEFSFPQWVDLDWTRWRPTFVDYLYLSFTNATAFSPTDVMPLSRWVKMTMMLQSVVALLLAILVVARAVNVLK